MQRLHDEDTTGHELKKKKKNIRHICLPGRLTDDVKPAELRERYVNGLLDPNRLSYDTLDKMLTELGSYGFAGQILQTPIKEGGNMVKKDWFGTYSMSKLKEEVAEEKRTLVWHTTMDGAYTEQEKNDPSALLCYAEWKNSIYIRDVAAVRMEMPELIRFIPEFVKRNDYSPKLSKIYIEPKANGLSVAQVLKKETKLNVILDTPPKDDKVVRLQACIPFIESGRVFILKEAGFLVPFLNEVCLFPSADHDDQVDVLTMAVRRAIKPERVPQRWHG
jgi:predicted phage terminase large subunit-like protein